MSEGIRCGVQTIDALLECSEDRMRISLLYACQTADDILPQLEGLVAKHDAFHVWHTSGHLRSGACFEGLPAAKCTFYLHALCPSTCANPRGR